MINHTRRPSQDFGDDYGEYLKADYSIECIPKNEDEFTPYYTLLFVYAIIMAAIFPVGVPLLYTIFLFRKRKYLNPPKKDLVENCIVEKEEEATQQHALALRQMTDYKVREKWR